MGTQVLLTSFLFVAASFMAIRIVPAEMKKTLGVLGICFIASVIALIIGFLMAIWG